METYELTNYFTIRFPKKEYPWPSKHDPERVITLTDKDILTMTEDGTIIKHGPNGCFGIQIPEEDLVRGEKPIKLQTA